MVTFGHLYKYKKTLLERKYTPEAGYRSFILKDSVIQWLDDNVEYHIENEWWPDENDSSIRYSTYNLHIHNDEDAVLFKLVWL
jgi:hypothetical protein